VISPDVYKQVELFVKLIVVFAIIISRLELFASKEPLVPSFFDGLGMGLGFMLGLCVLGAIREFFGAGQIWGLEILPFKPLLVMILPTGGFFVIGFVMALLNWIEYKITGKIPASGGGH
jgi:electron transport complex protein RnfE